MNTKAQIKEYLAGQPAAKQNDMLELHKMILKIKPDSKLWFLDGKDENGKIISNPNIGYGTQTIKYANGNTKEFYRIGMSANTSGISIYIMGIDDKKFLADTFGKTIGKASITGYCIKFKTTKDINTKVLEAAVKAGFERK